MMLIFDFDGVLMNSVRELAVTAYNAVTGKLLSRTDDLPSEALCLFLRNRFHQQSAGDAITLMAWSLKTGQKNPRKRLTSMEYEALLQEEKEPLVPRTKRLFTTRRQLQQKAPADWMNINRPYQPIWNTLIKADPGSIVLLTNKNRDAVGALCQHFGMPIPDANIYAGDQGVTKIENMMAIRGHFADVHRFVFIDDNVKNLKEIDAYFNRGTRTVVLCLASWGYCGPEDEKSARTLGYAALKMTDVGLENALPVLCTKEIPD